MKTMNLTLPQALDLIAELAKENEELKQKLGFSERKNHALFSVNEYHELKKRIAELEGKA